MLMLVLILLAVGFILGVLLWAWTLWFQAYIYEQATEGLEWRAPAAGGALLLVLILWCLLVSRNPGVQPLFDMTTGTTHEFDKLVCVKGRATVETAEPGPNDIRLTKDIVLKGAREVPYVLRRTGPRRKEFVEDVPNGKPWSRSDSDGIIAQIKVKEGSREATFQAELVVEDEKDAQGNVVKKVRFRPNKFTTWLGTESEQGLRYNEVNGWRVMTADQIGQVSESAWGTFVLSFVVNLLHLAVWFVCLWLLLRYQWAHALGLALVFWFVMTLFVVPMVLANMPSQSRVARGSGSGTVASSIGTVAALSRAHSGGLPIAVYRRN